MPFIAQEPSTFFNIKLTDHGRRLASVGSLKIDTAIISDREIDYKVALNGDYNLMNNRVLDVSHFYPDIEFENYDGSSPFTTNNFKISTEKLQVTGTTSSLPLSGKAIVLGDGRINYAANSANWGTNLITFNTLSYTPNVGDLVFVPWVDPAYAGVYSMAILPQNFPSVVQTYRIISAKTSTSFFVDRPIPNFATGSGPQLVVQFFQNNLIDGFIGKDPSIDPGIWNLNIVRNNNVTGAFPNTANRVSGYTTYGSIEFNGTNNLFGFTRNPLGDVGIGYGNIPMVGYIHYSNKYSGCSYAEQFIEGSFKLNLPTIMWHHGYKANYNNLGTTIFDSKNTSGTTWGLYATDAPGVTIYDQYSKSTYRELYDGNSTGYSIGRVYHKLKLVVITDQEVLTALTYKSNRNYTLPPFRVFAQTNPQIGLYPANAFSGTSMSAYTATGILEDGYDYFVTYVAENDDYTLGTSIGNPPAMHCGYIQRITGRSGPENEPLFLGIDFPYADSFPFMRDDEALSTGRYGTGWNANTVQILINRQDNTDRFGGVPINQWDISNIPANGWRRISDKTAGGNGVYRASDFGNNTIDGKKLNSYTFVVSKEDYNSGSTYNIWSGCTANQDFLNFGDESFLYGTVSTGVLSTVYKMKVSVYLKEEQFNGSMNSSFNEYQNSETYITEVALLSQGKVVAAGKPTYPIRKANTRILTLQLDYDF